MAKGDIAKSTITQKIIECFGQENVILANKKVYINTKENGEPIQIALALTYTKNPVGEAATAAAVTAQKGVDFGAFSAPTAPAPEPYKPAEITPEERQTVVDLMRQLGL